MKKILITGAGGFIGSHLTEYLCEKGFKVKAFLRYNANSRKGWLEESNIKNKIDIVFGDIRDFDSVYNAMKDVDTVFHLAALIGIPYSYESPLAYIKTNAEGTYNILESAKKLETRNILVTSTSETYGTAQYVPIDEKHPANAQSPYAASKVAADQLALSYHRSFNMPVKIVRPFNTYGPRQSLRAIIPTIAGQILKGKKEIYLGNTSPTRDFTFVSDTVKGFCAIAESEKMIGEVANIGMQDEISIKDLVTKISKQLGKSIKVISDENRIRPDKSEVERLYSSNKKIRSLTGWKPQYDLDQGLEETIDWLRPRVGSLEVEQYNV